MYLNPNTAAPQNSKCPIIHGRAGGKENRHSVIPPQGELDIMLRQSQIVMRSIGRQCDDQRPGTVKALYR